MNTDTVFDRANGNSYARAEPRFEAWLRGVTGERPTVPFSVKLPDGRVAAVGDTSPRFEITIANDRGLRALESLDELSIAEAYMDGDLDFKGSMRDVIHLREALNDQNVWITAWRRAQPLLLGWTKSHEQWVQNHYDANNIQLFYVDRAYNTYTPGVFESEDEPLEVASERKHRLAFEGLGLKAGDRILEVGFGWGSFLRYAARRGVHVTGLTLSKHQLAHVSENLLAKERLAADLVYTDFFDYEPTEKFDAIVMVGVIEELADFAGVMERIWRWLKPGKRVYIDFMAATEDFVFPSFVTKYIYQGITCRVYMPRFVDAVTKSPFELLAVHNDRRNYYLTAKRWYENYEANAEAIRTQYGERTYRMFRMYLAGAAHMLDHPSHLSTAFRVFLELPADHVALRSDADASAPPSPSKGPVERELRAAARKVKSAFAGLGKAVPAMVLGLKSSVRRVES
jgi:cyclopropane-fatty-acyl-phospholipid synthase